MASGFGETAPAGFAWSVTASDSSDLAMETRALFIGGDGDVALQMYDPESGNLANVTFAGLVAGQVLPIKTKRVLSTGTTATSIIALA